MSADYLAETIKAVQAADEARPRSQQVAVGWSEVGGCRRAIQYRLDDVWPSDEPDTWGAIRGTAIHNELERSRQGRPGLLHNVTTTYRGIPGHADEVDTYENSVTDWKTTRVGVLLTWQRDEAALRQKRIQVHGYAAGLLEAGVLDPDRPVTVRLLVAPVDGRFTDWWVYEEPYDQALADEGVNRVAEVQALRDRGEVAPRDEPHSWCADWCPFFTHCWDGAGAEDAPITDPELAAAVELYGEANQREAAAKKEKKALADLIRGLKGTARGWRVSMTEPSGMKPVPDLERIKADYAHNDLPLPTVQVLTSSPSLRVTKVKEKK